MGLDFHFDFGFGLGPSEGHPNSRGGGGACGSGGFGRILLELLLSGSSLLLPHEHSVQGHQGGLCPHAGQWNHRDHGLHQPAIPTISTATRSGGTTHVEVVEASNNRCRGFNLLVCLNQMRNVILIV